MSKRWVEITTMNNSDRWWSDFRKQLMEQRDKNIKSGRQGLFNLSSTLIMLVVRGYIIKAVATGVADIVMAVKQQLF